MSLQEVASRVLESENDKDRFTTNLAFHWPCDSTFYCMYAH